MPTWRDEKILELANQLTYSPADKRREQLHAAVALLPDVDPAKTYPWDFVHFRITSFQLRGHSGHVVQGKVLRADLASLIEFLSDTLSIKVGEAAPPGDAVMEFDDVSRKFNVSSKTIQRWRKEGLVALRYLYPDGRRRLGFLESAVAGFAAANQERVNRSAAFKQLTDEERAQIIALARQYAAANQCCIKDLSRLVGQKLGRAPETIRYTIRRYDREHPETAVFPETEQADAPVQREEHPEAERKTEGLSLEGIARQYAEPARGTEPTALQERAQQVKRIAIEYVPNPLYEHPDAEEIVLTVLPAEAVAKAQATVTAGTNAKGTDVYMARMPRDLPAYLVDIFRQPVMPEEIERDAFRRMNYLKRKAARLQAALDPALATEGGVGPIETLLAQAAALKNMILQGNLRVAVHVARKHQRMDRPLMELVSDATIWVMRAIETYDFSRNTRFSTYASYAVMKNFARDRVEQLTRRDEHVLTGQEEVLNEARAPQGMPLEEQLDAAMLQSEVLSVIGDLPAKDRDLIIRHYGLEQGKPALSLSEIGDQMGITKARVRQLEARALDRLRRLMEVRRESIRNTVMTAAPAETVKRLEAAPEQAKPARVP
jgi:RNA polymerase primary sigma factor